MPGKHLNSSSFQTISKPHFCWSNLLGRPHFLWVTWPRFPNTWSVASHVARSAAGHWNCFAAVGVTGWSPVTSLPGSDWCLGNPLAQMEGLTRHDSTACLSAFLFGHSCLGKDVFFQTAAWYYEKLPVSGAKRRVNWRLKLLGAHASWVDQLKRFHWKPTGEITFFFLRMKRKIQSIQSQVSKIMVKSC